MMIIPTQAHQGSELRIFTLRPKGKHEICVPSSSDSEEC
jgi:hypothetical protein